MQMMFMKRAVWGAIGTAAVLLSSVAHAVAVPGQGTWETTLLGRDIDGKPVDGSSESAVFLFDTALKITWLRDAFYVQTSGFSTYGYLKWEDSVNWVDNLTVGRFNGWRLPTSDDCSGYDCTGSEMGHLWYAALGNSGGVPMSNTGHFQHFQSSYWSGTEFKADTTRAWYLFAFFGLQNDFPKDVDMAAMAVRPGDVAAVPEPPAYAMLLLGLGAVIVAVSRRPR